MDDEKENERQPKTSNYVTVDDLSSSDVSDGDVDTDDMEILEDVPSILMQSVSDNRPAVYFTDDGQMFTEDQVNAIESMQSSVAELASPTNYDRVMFGPNIPDFFQSIERVNHMFYPNGSTGAVSIEIEYEDEDEQFPLLFNMRAATSSTGTSWSSLFERSLQPLQQFVSVNSEMASFQNFLSSVLRSPNVLNDLMQLDATRNYGLNAVSVVFLDNVRFSQVDYDRALDHFNVIVQAHNGGNTRRLVPSINILNVILEMWHTTGRTQMPLLGEVITSVLEEMDTTPIGAIPQTNLHELLLHWVANYGYVPSHATIEYIYQYYLLHNNSYPTEDELHQFVVNIRSFMMNPEEFHARDKMLVPALGVDRIPRYTNEDSEVVCSICQDDIKIGQLAMKLPPCNHVFHATNPECLEGGSVLDWLSRSNLCPLCKTKVTVN